MSPGRSVSSGIAGIARALRVAIALCAGLSAACDGGAGRVPAAAASSPSAAIDTFSTTSADFLALLPDGETKRRFLLDCTNCHTYDARIAFPAGSPRSHEDWVDAVQRMLGYAGAESAFPIMGVGRDADSTAAWLTRHGSRQPTGSAVPASLPEGASVDEFLLPEPGELPHDLAVLDDGRVLVTGMFTHQMWLLDPATGAWSTEAIPVPESNPRAVDTVRRPDGATDWWVLLGGPHQLARRDGRTGEWTTFDIGVYGHSVAPDAQGRVWFNSHFTTAPGIVGYVDASTGRQTRFDVPTNLDVTSGGTPIPYGLRVAPDGSVWGTELLGNRIVRLDPETGAVRGYVMPLPVSGPRRPDFDAAGRFWIPEYAGNALTRFDPISERFTRLPLPVRDALPYVVRIDRERNRIWIGTGAADAAMLFDPVQEEFTVFPLPSRGALVRHLDIDEATGDVWLAYGASPGPAARVARLRLGPR